MKGSSAFSRSSCPARLPRPFSWASTFTFFSWPTTSSSPSGTPSYSPPTMPAVQSYLGRGPGRPVHIRRQGVQRPGLEVPPPHPYRRRDALFRLEPRPLLRLAPRGTRAPAHGHRLLHLDRHLQLPHRRPVLGVRQRPLHRGGGQALVPAHRLRGHLRRRLRFPDRRMAHRAPGRLQDDARLGGRPRLHHLHLASASTTWKSGPAPGRRPIARRSEGSP